MKKHNVFACALCASLLLSATAYAEETAPADTHSYNATALLQEDAAFIPLREAADALGCSVTWDKASRTATLADDARQMTIQEGQELFSSSPADAAMVGMPTPQKMDAAFIDSTGRLYVSPDVFSILIGYDVTIDGSAVTILPQN